MNLPHFVLASASPARRKLLQIAGIEPLVKQSNFDESQIQERDPERLVQILAQAKAETVAREFDNALILGCDSVLAVNGEIHGKPQSLTEAIARWQQMRGKCGILYTGHVLIDLPQEKILSRCGITKVYFARIDDRTIVDYVQSQEPMQCAGAFALEGKGGFFVEKIEGCHSNVIGLSLPLLHEMLTDLGYRTTDFWHG
jgi:septum formation protein